MSRDLARLVSDLDPTAQKHLLGEGRAAVAQDLQELSRARGDVRVSVSEAIVPPSPALPPPPTNTRPLSSASVPRTRRMSVAVAGRVPQTPKGQEGAEQGCSSTTSVTGTMSKHEGGVASSTQKLL